MIDAEQPFRRQADLLVRGGAVLLPGGSIECIDVAARDGRVVALGSLDDWRADTTLDATGLHVLPGVIDSQVHFREPGLTHKETLEAGTRGAVLGGVTGIFEMPNTSPLTLAAADLQAKLDAARGRAWCDHAFYIGGSAVNAERLAELENLPGCAGVKVFMGVHSAICWPMTPKCCAASCAMAAAAWPCTPRTRPGCASANRSCCPAATSACIPTGATSKAR